MFGAGQTCTGHTRRPDAAPPLLQAIHTLVLLFPHTQEYRHIVLVVYDSASRKYGALGLSRRPELMDKPLTYDRLSDLVRATSSHAMHLLLSYAPWLLARC